MGLLILTPLKGKAPVIPFNPNQISGLILYLDPRLGVTMNMSNQVTQWDDQSPSVLNAQPFPTSPTNAFIFTAGAFGSQPGLAGDGSTTLMQLSGALSGLTAFTMFIVFKPDIMPANQDLIVNGSNFSLVALTSPGHLELLDSSLNFTDFGSVFVVGTQYLIQIQSTASPASAVMLLNGVSQTVTGSGGTSWNAELLYLGGDFRSGGPFRPINGSFGPLIVYNRSLSNPECSQVSTWLQGDGWF